MVTHAQKSAPRSKDTIHQRARDIALPITILRLSFRFRDHNLLTMGKSTTAVMQAGEFKAKCLAVLDEVASTGREMVITKRGRPIAKIVPLKVAEAAPLEGLIEYQGDLISPVGVEWKATK